MAAGGPGVSVLAPNGRRQTVRMTARTPLLQVLEEVCRKQNFLPNEYDLKFQRTVLDLSLQWRFANLPNNAKLEMVPCARRRVDAECATVRVALQLENGVRLQDEMLCSQTLWDLLARFPQIRTCLEQVDAGYFPVCLYMRDEVTGESALKQTSLRSLGLTGGSAIIRFIMKKCDQPVNGKQHTGIERPLPEDQRSVESSAASPTPRPSSAHTRTAPFIPFHGGGRRLGGASVPEGAIEEDVPCAAGHHPKALCSPGPSKPKKSKSSDKEGGSQPIDREPVVCHMDLEPLIRPKPQELPDDFFEVTVDDVRRRFSQLKSERHRLEETPLMTEALRESHVKEKLERYPKVVLRILFPDRYVLQGFFRPTERVGAVREFVRSHLSDPELPFYLFITPPRTELTENSQTLFQANLFPAAVLHFGSEVQRAPFLHQSFLDDPTSPSQADTLVARSMQRVLAPVLENVAALNPGEAHRAPETSTDQHGEPVSESLRPVQSDPGKVPKWLKLPGKK
ncbi:LOW QUALITY PROTEIN: tether containing UBX domain for GLUT4 [Ascaphus truei]|uniref:LOW QUALITY PROTEIN: tether containing UBX domain for GLUT4 n=1 Tax=Ascaphus truei TaxID=8439 RepID=UPI003F5A6BE1